MRPAIIASLIPMVMAGVQAQDRDAQGSVPIYRVTVIERTMKAINYSYRTGPTMIDFHGTVLLPKAKGEAMVESKQGRTQIDAHLENLPSPQGFGLEYMTYVLWAVTPEGRTRNLGEVVPNSSNKVNLNVTTDLKAFGLIITAEPYSAVRQPSDVVVVENQVREDTIGKIEEVNAKYELMPRGHYTWNMSNQLKSQVEGAPKVSMKKYEALLELYQAQNAIAIAKNAGADRYDPNTFGKAQALLTEAEQLNANKNVDSHRVVDSAREAAQTAEDARMIAERRKYDEQMANATSQVAAAEQAKVQARAEADRAREDAASAQSQVEAERAARERAEADASAAREQARRAQSEAAAQANRANAVVTAANAAQQQQTLLQDQTLASENQKSDLRMRMLEQLNGALSTRDTVWGLMATVPDRNFTGDAIRGLSSDQWRRLVAVVTAHPGLHVVVEGHCDSPSNEGVATKRAMAVRDALINSGLSSSQVEVRSLGTSRLLTSNNTESGREQNRRVEVIIAGDPIGKSPFWDRPYTITPRGN